MKKLFLGKSPARNDARNLKLSTYLGALPPPPAAINWGAKVPADWGMMGNDSVGDCTCAAAGHLEMLWTSYNPPMVAPTTAQILAAYSAITGYTPKNPNSDQGANVTDVLNFWRKSAIAGHKIFAFVAVDQSVRPHIQTAVTLFGALYIGVQLPQSAMDDFNAGKPWTRLTGKIIGGHAIIVVAYDKNGLTVVTWGREQKISWAWFEKYCDESFCILTHDWSGAKDAPSGFNFAQLKADLSALKTNNEGKIMIEEKPVTETVCPKCGSSVPLGVKLACGGCPSAAPKPSTAKSPAPSKRKGKK